MRATIRDKGPPASGQNHRAAPHGREGPGPNERGHVSFRVPKFPLTCRVWHNVTGPPFPPPLVPALTPPCQLRTTPGPKLAGSPVEGSVLNTLLLVPAKTDLRGYTDTTVGDLVECPVGTGRFYQVLAVEDVAKGFPNEYRLATVQQKTHFAGGWPFPTP